MMRVEVAVRHLLITLLVVGVTAPAWAQTDPAQAAPSGAPAVRDCRPFDAPPFVNVTMRDGRKLRGTLTCLGQDAELAIGGKLSRLPLVDVKKIAEPRDPVWEGPFVGAALGAVFWALCGSGCNSGDMARATAYYTLIGLVVDTATSNNKTIYKSAPAPALSFRLRF